MVKKLAVGLPRGGGRNFHGRITSYHRGGGLKYKYKLVDKFRCFYDVFSRVLGVYKDRRRSGFLFLVGYSTGHVSYILGTVGVDFGKFVCSFSSMTVKDWGFDFSARGSSFFLKDLAFINGTKVHSVECEPGQGASFGRAGGTYLSVVSFSKERNLVTLKMPSGEIRFFSGNCRCVLGVVLSGGFRVFSKAGHRRWLGFRPVVRGVAMNPVDHPHGGGEGKTSGGRCSVTPWGKLTKGVGTLGCKRHNLILKRK